MLLTILVSRLVFTDLKRLKWEYKHYPGTNCYQGKDGYNHGAIKDLAEKWLQIEDYNAAANECKAMCDSDLECSCVVIKKDKHSHNCYTRSDCDIPACDHDKDAKAFDTFEKNAVQIGACTKPTECASYICLGGGCCNKQVNTTSCEKCDPNSGYCNFCAANHYLHVVVRDTECVPCPANAPYAPSGSHKCSKTDPTTTSTTSTTASTSTASTDAAAITGTNTAVTCDGTDVFTEVGVEPKSVMSSEGGPVLLDQSTAVMQPHQALGSTLVFECRRGGGQVILRCDASGQFVGKKCLGGAGSNGKAGDGGSLTQIVVPVAITITILIIVIAIAVIVIIKMFMKRKNQDTNNYIQMRKSKRIPKNASNGVVCRPVKNAFNIPFEQLHIGGFIANGASGKVSQGTFAGKPVAIKELISVLFDPESVEDLEREASFLCSIHHPNIVRFYGISVDPSPERGARYYLVTELKDIDLREFVNQREQPAQDEVLRIALEICDALVYLHSLNVIHRDLKPGNVLLDANCRACLCDFGISKAYNENTQVDMTTNMGTAAYMAPELSNLKKYTLDFSRNSADLELATIPNGTSALIEKHTPKQFGSMDCVGDNNVDRITSMRKINTSTANTPKLDCYSFGIVLWVLLGWELPFRNMAPMQILIAVAYHNKRPSTRELANKWPVPLLDIMRQLWAIDPGERPPMSEVAKVLNQCI